MWVQNGGEPDVGGLFLVGGVIIKEIEIMFAKPDERLKKYVEKSVI